MREKVKGFDRRSQNGQMVFIPYEDLPVEVSGLSEAKGFFGVRMSADIPKKIAHVNISEDKNRADHGIYGPVTVMCTYSLSDYTIAEAVEVATGYKLSFLMDNGGLRRIENRWLNGELRKSEIFLSNVFDSIQDGISVLDRDLNILRVNGIMKKWYGENVIGKKCYVAYHGRNVPCDACPSINAMRHKTTGNGIVHDITGWKELYVFPMIDDMGDVTGVIENVRDITGRMNAEEALRESEETYRFLVENSKDIIWKIDLDGRWTFASGNVEKAIGYRTEELLGKTIWEILAPECHESIREKIRRRMAGEEIPTYEIWVINKDGHRIPFELVTTSIYDKNGNIIGAQGISRDITLRKRAEREVVSARAQAELYLDLMGHDISNMNQVGLGYLELALDTLDLDEHGREIISKSIGALESSSKLIDNVKKLQRARSGEISLRKVDLGQVLADVVTYYSRLHGENKIHYDPEAGRKVMANDLLYDVFSNIVGNAIKHSNGPLTIRILHEGTVENGRAYHKVSIEDDGPGIPDEVKGSIFDRFQRGATSAKGRGLGLYLVRTLVESYDGRVWVENRVPVDYKKGSRFVVLLPAAS